MVTLPMKLQLIFYCFQLALIHFYFFFLHKPTSFSLHIVFDAVTTNSFADVFVFEGFYMIFFLSENISFRTQNPDCDVCSPFFSDFSLLTLVSFLK